MRAPRETDTGARVQADGAIRRLLAALGASIEAGDFDAAANCFANDAVLMLPGSAVLEGRSKIRAGLASGFGAGAPKTEVIVTAVEVAASGELAYARGTGVTHTSPAIHTKWLAIFRRQPDDAWLLVADIFNDDGLAP